MQYIIQLKICYLDLHTIHIVPTGLQDDFILDLVFLLLIVQQDWQQIYIIQVICYLDLHHSSYLLFRSTYSQYIPTSKVILF